MGKIKTDVTATFMIILFSCTFALAAEGYTVPHHNEEQNETQKVFT
ncbi:hypothetical protein ABE096_19775 [Robertmurraya massiliosenegalensis]